MAEFNEIKFKGQSQDYSTLKAGLKRSDLAGNAKLESIFDAIDTINENGVKDGVLDESETQTFMLKIVEFAKGGSDKKLSNKDANKFLQHLGLSDINSADLFNLLNSFSTQSKNIKNITKNSDRNSNLIEYNDGNTEEVFQDGSKILTVLSENKTTVTKQDKDGKIIFKTETIINDGVETVIKYEGETPKTKTVKDTNNNTVSTYSLDGAKEILVKEENTKTGDVTTYENGTKTITKKDGTVIVEKDGELTHFNYDNEGNYQGKIILKDNEEIYYDEEDRPFSIKKKDGERILSETNIIYYTNGSIEEEILEYSPNGDRTKEIINDYYIDKNGIKRRCHQVLEYNGNRLNVHYDGEGNTFVVVQNGELISQLAKKFNCNVEDILKLNEDKVYTNKKDGHKYFQVGTEIKIPGELDADAEVLKDRKDSWELEYDYKKFRRDRILKNRVLTSEVLSKSYATWTDLATEQLKNEGIANPTQEEIADRTNILTYFNWNESVPKRGMRMWRLKTDEEIACEAREKARIEAEEIAGRTVNGEIDREFSQGNTGDCWLLAAIKAISLNPKGLEILNNSLKPDGHGNITVTLKGVNKSYFITAEELETRTKLSSGEMDVRAFEIAIEKYLKEEGPFTVGLDRVDDLIGGYEHIAYELLTGKGGDRRLKNTSKMLPKNNEKKLNRLIDKFNDPDFIFTVSAPYSDSDRSLAVANNQEITLYDHHAYTVKGSDNDNVYLINPHDTSKTISVPREIFKEFFQVVDGFKLK